MPTNRILSAFGQGDTSRENPMAMGQHSPLQLFCEDEIEEEYQQEITNTSIAPQMF